MKQTNLRTLIFCALLAALGAVFSAFWSIEIPGFGAKLVEISLAPVVVMLAGIFFGPLYGGMVGFVADTAGFFMGAQHGAYNPFFSVTMALFGIIAGLFFLKRKKNNASENYPSGFGGANRLLGGVEHPGNSSVLRGAFAGAAAVQSGGRGGGGAGLCVFAVFAG